MSTESLIVPMDGAPFTVGMQQCVRITGEGIAGAKIVADVDGPASVVAENSVTNVKCGHVIVGKEHVEFVIRPTGPGKVKVTVTTTFLKNEPTVASYEFEVK